MPASCECLVSLVRLRERVENGVAGDIRLLDVAVDDRLGDGLEDAANGLFELHVKRKLLPHTMIVGGHTRCLWVEAVSVEVTVIAFAAASAPAVVVATSPVVEQLVAVEPPVAVELTTRAAGACTLPGNNGKTQSTLGIYI